jgi:SAM-dependent MidA family methyltransferase
LTEIIFRETQKHGPISFARFMELALYCPVCGYYEKERDTVGRRGDFFTSVSVGSLFGELLAFQFAGWLDEVRRGKGEGRRAEAGASEEVRTAKCEMRIVEAGAHDGQLAKDVLTWLRAHRPELFRKMEYWIVEPSERRRMSQRETLHELTGTVRWAGQLSDLPGNPQTAIANRQSPGVCGIIFCNELLDAMPVHRLGWDAKKKEWFEWGVAVQDEKLVWAKIESPKSKVRSLESEVRSPTFNVQRPTSEVGVPHPASRIPYPDLPAALLKVLPDRFTTEACPSALNWWTEAARILRRGKLVTIDYGLSAEDFFAPERKEGTLRAYHRHHLGNDLLANPGEQDLTAHVNFTAIQSAGEAAGLKTVECTTQEKFLTQIAERVWKEAKDSGDWSPARRRQFRTLTHPEHLGRSFRVLVQSRE